MYALYSLLTAVGMTLLSPYFLVRGLIHRKYLSNLGERFGWIFPRELQGDSAETNKTSIWIHAVSVGEVLAALPLAKRLKERYPEKRLLISTTTITGQQLARERMQFADAIFYFPLDWKGPVRRALATVRPSMVIIVETEIWPNFLRECRLTGVPVIFVNGRLSEKSFRGFARALSWSGGILRSFLKRILNDGTIFLMQSEADASRLLALGADERRVVVTGNLKYDFTEPSKSPLSTWLEKELGNNRRKPLVVAGSVMAGEESSVLSAFEEVEKEFPDALLILAPRKPDQFDNAAKFVAGSGHPLVRRAGITLNGAENFPLSEARSVLLLDTLGELADLYRLADAVFVGGSLVPIGGHNILEPAAFGRVPIHGPSMENFREMAANFLQAGASIQVSDAKELGAAWRNLLSDPARAARMGASARNLVDRNRGATERVLAHIEQKMDQRTDAAMGSTGGRK